MNIGEIGFSELFPDKEMNSYDISIKYSGHFKGYNANVKYRGKNLTFNLSKNWKGVSKDIQIGLIQELLLRVFKEKGKTNNIDLYNIFMKNVHISIPKNDSDPVLEESFNRINEKYFYGLIDKPNLIWGGKTVRKLGSYEYGTDTVTISSIFKDEEELLDYIMYHEVLHKKHKFKSKNGRSFSHTKGFKDEEKRFTNSKLMEKKLSSFVRKARFRKSLFF